MAGARRLTALPPREPARAAPLPRPAPSRTAASRPRPRGRGPAPPVGSRAETSPFREQFGGDSYPPTPAAHPLAVGLYRCLHLQRAPVCVHPGVGVWRPPKSPACLPPSPLSLPEGRPEPFSMAGCPLCACRAAAAADPPRPGVGFDHP